ncbi:MAG: NrsF family protein [Dongiaceae bacterium]
MITKPDLIRRLVADATPVRRLRPPLLRAGAWIAFALAVSAIVAASFGVRPDLGAKLRDPFFAIEIGAAFLTGVTAAMAAFHLSLPDRRGRWIFMPVPTLLLWLSTVGYGCLTNWVALGPDGLTLGPSLRCFATIVLVGTPLALVLLGMLRRARSLRPTATAAVGALAVAALTASALRLFHDLDASAMVLIWNVGAGAAIAVCVALFSRRVFSSAMSSCGLPDWSSGSRQHL